MKLLFLLTYYTPHWTGLTEHARRLAEALSNEGETVTVLTTQHETLLPKQEHIGGVVIIRTPVLFRLSRTMISPGLFLKMWNEIGKHETVIAYTPYAEVIVAAFMAKIRGKRFIILHNGDLILPKGMINRIIEGIFDVTGYIAGMLTDCLIAYSDDYAKHSRFIQPFLNKTTAIFPLFPPIPVDQITIQRLRKRLPSRASCIVGFAGRFVEEKGFDILLKAIPLVVERIPDALFVFAGETHMAYEHFFEQNQELLNSVDDHFYSFGLLTREEMAAFYRLLDVFVLPSRSDCLALVQVEAMQARVPVVVTGVPGARIAVQKTGMGEVVAPENPKALAEGILRVMRKKIMYQKRLPEVKKVFDYQTTLQQYMQVLGGKIK
jgi:glycosyltransferase involved in cell wall biosynthesis